MGNCIFVFPQETLLELLHSLAKLLPYFCPQKTLFFLANLYISGFAFTNTKFLR